MFITCFIVIHLHPFGLTLGRKSQSIAYILRGNEHVYWTWGLQGEVHQIWDLWTSDIQECKNNFFLESSGASIILLIRIKKNKNRVGVLGVWDHRPYPHDQCVFLTKFMQVFDIWHAKILHKNKMRVNWHTQSRFWHVMWVVKKKPHINWHFTQIENVTWHFGFEIERQMKFLKHTQCPWSHHGLGPPKWHEL